jgi:hypothetical protein
MSRSPRWSRGLHGRVVLGSGARTGLVSATVWQAAGQQLALSASKRQVSPPSTRQVSDLGFYASSVCESLVLLLRKCWDPHLFARADDVRSCPI